MQWIACLPLSPAATGEEKGARFGTQTPHATIHRTALCLGAALTLFEHAKKQNKPFGGERDETIANQSASRSTTNTTTSRLNKHADGCLTKRDGYMPWSHFAQRRSRGPGRCGSSKSSRSLFEPSWLLLLPRHAGSLAFFARRRRFRLLASSFYTRPSPLSGLRTPWSTLLRCLVVDLGGGPWSTAAPFSPFVNNKRNR